MISALTGTLKKVDEDRVHLQAGPILYELLVPAADVPLLGEGVGDEMTFHTIFYLQGDATGGNSEPRLIGFLRPDDKKFFSLFTTVKGIGPRTALRALTVPVGEIAQAIESRDARALVKLDGIGKRTAELIIAELGGKVGRFVDSSIAPSIPKSSHSPEDEAAIAVLISPHMGLRRIDAESLLARVKQGNPSLKRADDIVPEMLRLHAMRQ